MSGGESRESLRLLLERVEHLYRDHSLSSVRDWKRRTGSLAIGFMPVYVPRELLHSQGVLPVGIMGGGDDLEIIRGDAYYQSYICHIPRSTIELGLNGSLDCLDGMIFPATCDVIRNLSGMWQLQFPEKLSCYLDVPQNFDAAIALDARIVGRRREEYFRVKLQESQSQTGIRVSLAAEQDGMFCGFLLARVYYGEFGTLEPVAVLDTLGVHPGFRGRGVGAALHRQLQINLKALGVDRLQTEVSWDNQPLLGFFHRQGFQPAPRICLELDLSKPAPESGEAA